MREPTPGSRPRTAIALHYRILIGLLAGAALGALARQVWPERAVWFANQVAGPVGQVFLNLIFMTVIPLVVCALATGVAGLGDLVRLGRVGLRTLAFTVVISALAVAIGIGLVNVARPGAGLPPETQAALRSEMQARSTFVQETVRKAEESKGFVQVLVDLVPRNPLEEAVNAFNPAHRGGGLLAVMFFALMLGVALTSIPAEKADPVTRVLEGGFAALMWVIGLAMRLAPFCVAALLFKLTATVGLGILGYLARYVAVVLGALALHQFGVYALLLRTLAKASPWRFFGAVREAMLVAFSTSSSNATLPTSLRVAQENLGVPRPIANFVLTLGATVNQNGTALYEGVTVLFLAQFFGVDLTLGQQLQVVLMAVLAGVGTAGVPGGSLPMVMVVMQSVRVPPEGIAVILGVDRILDMCRTTVNVTGDLVVAAYVGESEGARLHVERAEAPSLPSTLT
jgi:DAACS family dicarboxylate/amino acid:cation (Na+ or H+) symporter